MKVGIVGGGLMGLALAQRLTTRGHRITVYERDIQLGGLATYYDYGPFIWDRFYHVILPSDKYLVNFLRDIGLGDQIRWRRTLTGFYVDRMFYSMSSGLEFLKFPPVSMMGKIRLALTILYCSRIKDWRRLEKIPLEPWLIRLSGQTTYNKIWKPLLLAKLGENYKRVSAVLIWTYIKRLFSARDPAVQKEQLGYVSGGYKAVFDRLEELITGAEGCIHTRVTVERIESGTDGQITVKADSQLNHFDKVIFTGPVNVLEQVTSPALVDLQNKKGGVEYLGVICAVLVTRKPLVPYYIVNIADPSIHYTGIIGMSNLVSLEETAGRHITYLPKYVHSDDPILQQPDAELKKLFMDGLYRMFPKLDEHGIEELHINRAVKVQPLQVLNYSNLVPRVTTKHPNFFVLNTSQFLNNTLNNNEVITAVDEFIKNYIKKSSQEDL